MNAFRLLMASLLLAALASPLAAKSRNDKNHLVADTLPAFQQNAREVRQEMGAGGRFSELDRSERESVETQLGVMEALLTQYGSVDKLPPAEKVELINAQELANAVLTNNDGDRIVCEMIEPTGSKMRQRQCRKAADIARTRDIQRDGMRNQTRAIMNAPKNGL